MPADQQFVSGLFALGLLILVFLALREVVMWYWKINKTVAILTKIEGHLTKIEEHLARMDERDDPHPREVEILESGDGPQAAAQGI